MLKTILLLTPQIIPVNPQIIHVGIVAFCVGGVSPRITLHLRYITLHLG